MTKETPNEVKLEMKHLEIQIKKSHSYIWTTEYKIRKRKQQTLINNEVDDTSTTIKGDVKS